MLWPVTVKALVVAQVEGPAWVASEARKTSMVLTLEKAMIPGWMGSCTQMVHPIQMSQRYLRRIIVDSVYLASRHPIALAIPARRIVTPHIHVPQAHILLLAPDLILLRAACTLQAPSVEAHLVLLHRLVCKTMSLGQTTTCLLAT